MSTRARRPRIFSAPPHIGQSFVLFACTKRKTALFHKAVIICHYHRAPSPGDMIPHHVTARNFRAAASDAGHPPPAVAGHFGPAETIKQKELDGLLARDRELDRLFERIYEYSFCQGRMSNFLKIFISAFIPPEKSMAFSGGLCYNKDK